MHRAKRNRINKGWYELVRILTSRDLPPKPLNKCTVTAILYNARNLDYDGAVGSLKPLIDGFVHAGVMRNDSYVVTGPWQVDQKHCKKGQEKVVIQITERE